MRKIIIFILITLNLALLLKLNYLKTLQSGNTPMLDFDAYLILLKDAREGINPYASTSMQTLGPPLVFSYFLPFSFFSYEKARILTTLLNIFSGIGISALFVKYYFKKNIIIFLILNILFFSAFPVRFSLEMGQPNIFIAFLVTTVILTKNAKLKAFLIALLVAAKTFYIFSLIVFLKKNKQVFLYSIFFVTLISVVLLPLIKPEWYEYFLSNKTSSLFKASEATNLDYYNQTIFVAISRLGLVNIAVLTHIVITVVLLLLTMSLSSFPLAIITSLALSPVSWVHYFVVLFPIFIYIFRNFKKTKLKILMLMAAFFLWWVEFPSLHTAQMTLFNRMLASHYLISMLISVVLLSGIRESNS